MATSITLAAFPAWPGSDAAKGCPSPFIHWCGPGAVWCSPDDPSGSCPVLNRQSLESEGFQVIERRQPSLLLGGSVLITGEVDRTTDLR